MVRLFVVMVLFVILLVPAHAFSQSPDRITILDNLGTYQKGQILFVFGQVANVTPDAFLIMQISNPRGDLCQIQQITPLSNGVFITDPTPLSGNICGIEGNYNLRLFYGDHAKSSLFTVSGQTFASLDNSTMFDTASALAGAKIQSIQNRSSLNLDEYSSRLASATSLPDLESLYVDLWAQFIVDDSIFDVNPMFRPIISSAIDSTKSLLDSGQINSDMSKQINGLIYSAIFHYEIGNTNKAVTIINDAFEDLKNIDPIKTTRQLSFSELEDTLLNLMKKTDTVMSSQVKEEIAFILSRGTAPLHSDDISDLVDILSKSRYLDVVSRKDTPLYRLVSSDWNSTRDSLRTNENISDLLAQGNTVGKLHAAALLLHNLNGVDRFISSDKQENSDLANILKPKWDSLVLRLELATSVDDILASESEIASMKNVSDISSRISKSVEIAQTIGIDTTYVDNWKSLLANVKNADSLDDILDIVTAFDNSITELRDKRNPLDSLKFEYEQLKQKAEIQADYKNLILINQALRAIHSAEQIKDGIQTFSKIDRVEVLLTWASQIAPSIRNDLQSNASKSYEAKASDILQRAKSIENLAELSLRKNKFLPGFVDFTDSVNQRLDRVRHLVMQNDLDSADSLVRELFSEWKTVSGAYADDPNGSDTGYSLDELQRIKYREQLEVYSEAVSAFYNSDFAQHAQGYNSLVDDAYELIEYGNFIDADKKIKEIGKYLADHLPLKNPKIIFDISYDSERDIWTLQGAVDKSVHDRRENLYVTIYDIGGDKHSFLEFTDTRQGDFFTQWIAPTAPGLYTVMLQYQDARASQIAHIADTEIYQSRSADLDSVEFARQFEELQNFMETFGSGNYESNPLFISTISEIKSGLINRNVNVVSDGLADLERLIERYLPTRNPSAVIEANYDNDVLLISGAVQKTIEFREDLFVDIYNQQGTLVESVALKDSPDGMFNESLSIPFDSGVHVAQLEYHDLVVTDFFTVP